MRIVDVTDAWEPQQNGVVRTMKRTRDEAAKLGHDLWFVTPNDFVSFPCPTYPEIRLSLVRAGSIGRRIEALKPDALHISTEGPLGYAARAWCRREGIPFTTAYHTRFPEYVQTRFRWPLDWSYAMLRRFHGAAARTMVATPSLHEDLTARGFGNLAYWSRGVDLDHFHPVGKGAIALKGPIFINVGRVAPEKNIEAFLALDLPGTKVVVGDGPARAGLERRFPEAVFLGRRSDADLPALYAAADVFVFPSRTDTFGLVLLEAMACGVPVAAYPVMGPRDVVTDPAAGALDEDLRAACLKALELKPEAARTHALRFSWESAAKQFLGNLAPIR